MIATVVDRAGDQLGQFLPRLGGALVLIVAGLLIAGILGRLTRKALERAGLDRLAERAGASELLGRGGLGSSLSALVATAVRLTVIVVACFAALTLLGLAFLSASLNQAILFIPQLVMALVLVLVGIVVGALARAWADRTTAQLDFPLAIGPVVQVVVVVLFGLCAAAQAGVSVAPLVVVALLLLGTIAVTLALAFGLGAREVARSLTSARYAQTDFAVGQTIRVGELRGEILRMDAAALTLKAGEETIRVPNSVVVEQIVVIEGSIV